MPSNVRTATPTLSQETRGIARAQEAVRLPMPVPLLLQQFRPLQSEDDVASLAAQLDSARSRGCF